MYTKKGYVYIMFNKRNGTLYVGMTSFLKRRVYEHKTKLHPQSFTAKYDVDKLGYFEEYPMVVDAIAREKQIKGGSRADKIALIEGMNPNWEDLYDLLWLFLWIASSFLLAMTQSAYGGEAQQSWNVIRCVALRLTVASRHCEARSNLGQNLLKQFPVP